MTKIIANNTESTHSSPSKMKFVVIIPAKNEQQNIKHTLSSLVAQTHKPEYVLVIDNDSTDNTARVIQEFSSRYSNIGYYNYTRENSYSLGGKIVRIFNAGKKLIDKQGIEYDYIVKMDADIRLNPNIFERISLRLNTDNYGIISPLAYSNINGKLIHVSSPDWHTLGDFKVYNRKAFEQMGGLKEDLGWDCADNISAIQLGYKTMIFRDIYYEQNRPIGRYSLLRGWKRQGLGAYKLRYDLLYLFIKAAHDLFKAPYILGSLYYLWGYFYAMIHQQERVLTKEQGKIFRSLIWRSLFDRIRNGHFYLLQSFRRKKTAHLN